MKFGFLAWGGPIAQIDMIRQELVEEEQWIKREKFNRVLGIYQALPGPEAHELCVYFGMLKRGRLGGLLAGLGFMLPGFVLILLLSWLYLMVGITSSWIAALFFGIQTAVIALIFRAAQRLGRATITNRWLAAVFLLSLAASFVGVHFALVLLFAGLAYLFLHHRQWFRASVVFVLFVIGMFVFSGTPDVPALSSVSSPSAVSSSTLFWSGLKGGLLTFGGAYSVIPFLRHDAVINYHWMTDAQFLDGLGLSGILPAPLVIFGTFVGFLGGSFLGALLVTLGIFLPAFGFTLVLYPVIEKLSEKPRVHDFLDGFTAGVIGLVVVTAFDLFLKNITTIFGFFLFLGSLIFLYQWKSKAAVPVVILLAGGISLVAGLV